MTKKGTRLRILLLEDDPIICDIVSEFLEECGYEVVSVYDGDEAMDRAYEERFDAFIFDVKVPSKDGFDVLASLRTAKQEVPAIFITSLASLDDLSRGYDAGCDDYIKKPFELRELQLRLSKLLKKSFSLNYEDKVVLNNLWAFEPNSGKLSGENGELFLTKKEAKILKTLISHRGQMVSREEIINAAWGYDEEATEESLRTYIKKLRKILGKEMIQNIRKQGYLLAIS